MSPEELEQERLTAFLEGAQKERSRIGRELHDGIGAMLFAISNQLDSYSKKKKEAGDQDIDTIMCLIHETAKALRDTAHCLIPEVLVLKGIEASLTTYCKLIDPGEQPLIQLHFFGDWTTADPALLHTVYRMAQELISNIIRHARASKAFLTLSYISNTVRIFAEDDGRGFDLRQASYGSGLYNLNARVKLLNGTIHIESAPGKGTNCSIIITV